MFDEESDLAKPIDLEVEIQQMESKAFIIQQKSQNKKLQQMEFSKLVLNSIHLMEAKFNEMSAKFDNLNKENDHKQRNQALPPIIKKSISVGKLPLKPIQKPHSVLKLPTQPKQAKPFTNFRPQSVTKIPVKQIVKAPYKAPMPIQKVIRK